MASVRKRCEAFSLAKYVLVAGITADIPCTYYYYLKLFYIISGDSSHCRNCVKAKKLCNGILVVSSCKSFLLYFIK
jgi:hypothetical protein